MARSIPHAELAAIEPLGAVTVQTDDVLPRHVGGEGELAHTAVHLGQDDLVFRVPDLNMHPWETQILRIRATENVSFLPISGLEAWKPLVLGS